MKKNLLKSTVLVSLMTVISRITGYMRELAFAYVFGAGAGLDAFLVAYRIPNFLRRLFAEGAFSQAFIPILSEYHQKYSAAEVKLFLDRIAGAMMLILFIFTALAIITTPWLVYIFAPGFIHDPTQLQLTATMLKITFPYILFISLTAYVSGILNTYGQFGIPAFTPNLLNFALIGAAIFLAPHFHEPVKALAWGIFIGGVAQLLFQLPFLCRLNLFPHPKFFWQDPGLRRVLKMMVPAIFGVSVAQLSILFDLLFASFLPHGSMSWIYFSDRLTSFPLGVFGVAIATVVLPHLSRKFAAKSEQEYSQALDWALKFILLIALPATIAMAILAGPMLATLLQYGKFSAFAVTMARRSLWGFTIGIPAFMLVKVLASGFYSRQNIKTPVKIAIIALVTNILLNALLIFPLKHAGLTLSTSIASMLNAGLLFWTIRKQKHYQPGNDWKIFWLRLLLANFIMAVVLWFSCASLSIWLQWNWFTRVWHLGLLCSVALLVYCGCLWISGMKWREFLLHET